MPPADAIWAIGRAAGAREDLRGGVELGKVSDRERILVTKGFRDYVIGARPVGPGLRAWCDRA